MGMVRTVIITEIALRTEWKTREKNAGGWKALDPVTRKTKIWVGELLVWEDALYVTGDIGEVEVELLSDTGCSLSLISVDLYGKIPESVRPKLLVNNVDMTTADGS